MFALGVLAFEMPTGKPPFVEPPLIARLHGREVVMPSCDGLPAVVLPLLVPSQPSDPAIGQRAAITCA